MFEKIRAVIMLFAAGTMIVVVGLGVAFNCNGKAQKCSESVEPPDHIIL